MNQVVCLKQVPAVSELPWNAATGVLLRDRAEAMLDPAARQALEAALLLKAQVGGSLTVVTMGPPQAEEVLREALTLGADSAVLLTDPAMAGADTLATSATLAQAIKLARPDFDLVLGGAASIDSETGQVGPQLAEELKAAGAAYVEKIEPLKGRRLKIQRTTDGFLESLEIDLPAVLTIAPGAFLTRPAALTGLEPAFGEKDLLVLDARKLGADPKRLGAAGSATHILKVYPAQATKKNIVLRGAVKKSVEELFARHGGRLTDLIDQGLRTGRRK